MIIELAVQIVRWINDDPGYVECEFVDARGKLHTVIDKLPIFGDADLGKDSPYPQPGAIRCREIGSDGGEIITLATDIPDEVESNEGIFRFTVSASQVIRKA